MDDLADALVFLLQRYSGESHVNVGTGEGSHHPRPGGAGLPGRRLRGRAALRRLQARRHAAQAAGRLAPGRDGMAAEDRPRRGRGGDLPRRLRRPAPPSPPPRPRRQWKAKSDAVRSAIRASLMVQGVGRVGADHHVVAHLRHVRSTAA
ncbi:MAG: hypothetical protein WDM92_00325 [Caulobacteraceae bacterium]